MTRRTGWGLYFPAFMFSTSSEPCAFRCASSASTGMPSTPGLPLFALTCFQALFRFPLSRMVSSVIMRCRLFGAVISFSSSDPLPPSITFRFRLILTSGRVSHFCNSLVFGYVGQLLLLISVLPEYHRFSTMTFADSLRQALLRVISTTSARSPRVRACIFPSCACHIYQTWIRAVIGLRLVLQTYPPCLA